MRPFFAALALFIGCSAALAQGYPSKPITFVIPFAAGGDSDLSGRNLAQFAPKYLNSQPIIALNRVGASGVIGAMAVRTAPAASRPTRWCRRSTPRRRTSGTSSRCSR